MKLPTEKQFHLLPLILTAPPLTLGLCVLAFQLLETGSPSQVDAVGNRYLTMSRALYQSAQAVSGIMQARNQPVNWSALEALNRVEAPAAETATAGKPAEELKLQGIAWDENRPLAFLNDQVLTVNDQLYGYRVTEIRERAVVLVDEHGADTTLKLNDGLMREDQAP